MLLFAVCRYILVLNAYIILQVDVILLLSHAHYEHFDNNIVQIQVDLIFNLFLFFSSVGLKSTWLRRILFYYKIRSQWTNIEIMYKSINTSINDYYFDEEDGYFHKIRFKLLYLLTSASSPV